MPRNSQGDCSQNFNWVEDAANGIDIEPDRHQTNDDDHLQMLTDSLDRLGRGGMQAPLAMGNNQINQVSDGTTATDAANVGQIQAGDFSYAATDLGTADAYVVNLSPAPSAYDAGLVVSFVAANANTGASTLQVGGLVPAPSIKWQSLELVADTIKVGDLVTVRYDGTDFVMISSPETLPSAYGGTGTTVDLGTAAFEDVGTAIGDVVQLEDVGGNASLPAVDGSQVTNVPTSLNRTVFTASGSFDKTVIPAGVKNIRVTVKGAGGAGAFVSGTAAGQYSAGGGGGEGGTAIKDIAVSALGALETVTVGAGVVSAAGESSSFGTFCTGNGGQFATFREASSDIGGAIGGAGGTATGGDVNIQGAAGGTGIAAPSDTCGGQGGGSGGGLGAVNSGTGNAGAANTGGGGGGAGNGPNQTSVNGGVGGAGIVIVEWVETV